MVTFADITCDYCGCVILPGELTLTWEEWTVCSNTCAMNLELRENLYDTCTNCGKKIHHGEQRFQESKHKYIVCSRTCAEDYSIKQGESCNFGDDE